MWIAGLLLLALTISLTRAVEDDEVRDKRRGPWQRLNKEIPVYLAHNKAGDRVPWGQRLVRDEASFGRDESMVGPNVRWGSSRMTYAWQPTDEDDMVQGLGMRAARIKRPHPSFVDFINRNFGLVKQQGNTLAANKRASPVFSLKRLLSSVPPQFSGPEGTVPLCDPNRGDLNSDECKTY